MNSPGRFLKSEKFIISQSLIISFFFLKFNQFGRIKETKEFRIFSLVRYHQIQNIEMIRRKVKEKKLKGTKVDEIIFFQIVV